MMGFLSEGPSHPLQSIYLTHKEAALHLVLCLLKHRYRVREGICADPS